MIAHIVRHEWRLLATEGSLWLVVGIFAMAIGYGTFNGTGGYASNTPRSMRRLVRSTSDFSDNKRRSSGSAPVS